MHAIDHLFVFCRPQAPELTTLQAHGLLPGLRRDHPGQGTANVCIGFADAYLELLWLADETAARDPHVKPLGLQERARWRETGASPFGIAVRPEPAGAAPPFVPWDYRPSYLPPGMSIAMACNSGVLGEPLLFQVDRPYQSFGPRPWSARRLVLAELVVPDLAPMSLLREVRVPGLRISDGPVARLDLHFDGAGTSPLDLQPSLPMRLFA
jgi:Glyoxalase-like domain